MNFKINWDEISLYDVECLCRLFFDNKTIKNKNTNDYVLLQKLDEEKTVVEVCINGQTRKKEITERESERERQRKALVMLYTFLSDITSIVPPWGILTGIRPVKLFRNLKKELGEQETKKLFTDDFLVFKTKAELACETSRFSDDILENCSPQDVSLYVSIPFCPSKCSYCSFVSSSIQKTAHLVEKYVELLCEELKVTAKIMRDKKLNLKTIYIGGGTPTTLNAQTLKKILSTINQNFKTDNIEEFTVEAGRPDTITEDKLLVLKDEGVSRISINPQTFNDNVLKVIGRNHNSKQIIDSFNLARDVGIKNVNMDLIAGLPTDTFKSFQDTLENVINLSPENVTIHTLSIKRASNLSKENTSDFLSYDREVLRMLDFAHEKLQDNEFFPYYLYRQSNMIGNLENVGWSKKDARCLYNVYIMDEVHTIISCGAGAVTKLCDMSNDSIERVFNFKYPYEYVSRFDELLLRKERVRSFYDKL